MQAQDTPPAPPTPAPAPPTPAPAPPTPPPAPPAAPTVAPMVDATLADVAGVLGGSHPIGAYLAALPPLPDGHTVSSLIAALVSGAAKVTAGYNTNLPDGEPAIVGYRVRNYTPTFINYDDVLRTDYLVTLVRSLNTNQIRPVKEGE